MTATELYSLLIEAGIPETSIHVLDTEYSRFTRAFAYGEFASAFEKFKGELGRSVYTRNVNDCDKFALLAHWYAQYLNAENPEAEKGIAFGNFTYLTREGIYHQINALVVEGDRVIFFEPQDSSFPTLTNEEITSCTALNI